MAKNEKPIYVVSAVPDGRGYMITAMGDADPSLSPEGQPHDIAKGEDARIPLPLMDQVKMFLDNRVEKYKADGIQQVVCGRSLNDEDRAEVYAHCDALGLATNEEALIGGSAGKATKAAASRRNSTTGRNT